MLFAMEIEYIVLKQKLKSREFLLYGLIGHLRRIGLSFLFPYRNLSSSVMESLMKNVLIRNEKKEDYCAVENLVREAFYNLYIPGCIEHYLVHLMRGHEDFIPELDLVLETDEGRIIGCIMYTKAFLFDEDGNKKPILTFGPLCIHPEYQRRGYGRYLMECSFQKAISIGYDTVVIFGSPVNYVGSGFRSCHRFGVSVDGERYPAAMLVKELIPGTLGDRKWRYQDSPVMSVSREDALRYDDTLERKERLFLPSQEEFYIMSHAFIE